MNLDLSTVKEASKAFGLW